MMNRLLLFSIISYVYRIPEMGLFISIKHKDKEQIVSSVLSYFRVFTKRRIQIFIDKYNVKFSIIE